MKKAASLFIVCMISLMIFSQQDDKSFNKGDHVMEAGLGAVLFGKNTITYQDTVSHDSLASMVIPLYYQYGITPWLGLGGVFRFYNHFEGENSENTQAIGIDAGIFADLHYLRSSSWDLSLKISTGYGRIQWVVHDANNSKAYGSGMHYDFELNFRKYFNERVGMNFFYSRIIQDFPQMVIENDLGDREEFDLFLHGARFGLSLQVKL